MKIVIKFKFKEDPKVPVEVRQIIPDKFINRDIKEVLRELQIWIGNRKSGVEELFDIEYWIEEDKEGIDIIFEGDGTRRLRYVGYRMSIGKIEVRGSVGPLAGYRMRGGELVIYGDADHYLGSLMKNGKIEVYGNAGSFVGGKLIGIMYGHGMRGGTIIIHGNAESFIGHGMKSGDIIIEGNVNDFAGYGMKGGNILIMGDAGIYPGARMSGGRIIILGKVEEILPSFYIDSIVSGIKFKGKKIEGRFAIFIGDVLMESRGRLIINYEHNIHIIKPLEKLLEPIE